MSVALNRIKTWVYVTGVPRSGTTFVGKVLSLPLAVDYIHEPFSPGCGMPGMTQRYLYVRPTPDTEEMRAFASEVEHLFDYSLQLKTKVPKRDKWTRQLSKRLAGSRGPFYLRLAKLNPFHEAAVVKDPTAPFVAAYLRANHGVVPVVVVKHPVSLAASLKRLDWHPTLRWFATQPALIADYFAAPEERAFLERTWKDPIEAAAAHWRAVHRVLLQQAEQQGGWHILTHEALSAEPVATFQGLFTDLGLPWSSRVERKVLSLTSADHAGARKGRVQDFHRDSAALFDLRRSQLSLDERRRIFDITADVALQLYDRDSFALDEQLAPLA